MTQYLSIDVLEIEPDGADPRGDTVGQRIVLLDSGLGARTVVEREGAPYLTRAFRWVCFDESEVAALRAFITARKGRAIPFWMQTHTRELQLASFPGLSTLWTIKKIGYVENLFPTYGARRHVYGVHPVQAPFYRQVVSAVDNGDGTETMTLASGPGVNIATDAWLVGFLRYCRLADDRVQIKWRGRTAFADFAFIELPHEAPT